MLRENLEAFERFCLEGRANELRETTLEGYRHVMRRLDESLRKPFKEASSEDIMRFFTELQQECMPSTVHLWKMRVKRFYNWLLD